MNFPTAVVDEEPRVAARIEELENEFNKLRDDVRKMMQRPDGIDQ